MLSKVHIKIFKTFNTYFSFFTLSMVYNLTGPCLLDLQHLVHADSYHMALIYTSRSIGYLLGAIIVGILLDALKSKQTVLVACHAIVTGTILGIPWTRNIQSMMGVMVVNGLSLGAIDTGDNVMCLRLWGKDSNAAIHGMYFMFGIGGFLAPLITAPFLENFDELSPSIDNATYLEGDPFTSADSLSSSDNITGDSIPKIVYPYSMVGAISLLATILFLTTCIISPTEADVQSEETDNSDVSFLFLSSIITCIFLLLFVGIGTETAFGQTLTAYAVKGPLHSTSTVGSYMTSAYWGAFTLSRLASVFLSTKVNSLVLMIANACIVTLSALVLQFFMPNEWALWLASVLLGVGVASNYPSLVAILTAHIHVTSKIAAIFIVGASAGAIVVPFTVIYFLDRKLEVFSFTIAASSVLLLFLLFALYCVLKVGNRSIRVIGCNYYVIDGVREVIESYGMRIQ